MCTYYIILWIVIIINNEQCFPTYHTIYDFMFHLYYMPRQHTQQIGCLVMLKPILHIYLHILPAISRECYYYYVPYDLWASTSFPCALALSLSLSFIYSLFQFIHDGLKTHVISHFSFYQLSAVLRNHTISMPSSLFHAQNTFPNSLTESYVYK